MKKLIKLKSLNEILEKNNYRKRKGNYLFEDDLFIDSDMFKFFGTQIYVEVLNEKFFGYDYCLTMEKGEKNSWFFSEKWIENINTEIDNLFEDIF